MMKNKASGVIFLLGGFVLEKKGSPELSSNGISSESDRHHYYGSAETSLLSTGVADSLVSRVFRATN